jgi:hypothetical protein
MGSEDAKSTPRDTKQYKIRIPLPLKPEKPHSTRKGKRGYNRKKDKARQEDLIQEE